MIDVYFFISFFAVSFLSINRFAMTEIRETLRFASTDLEEMNRVMGRLQDRLDALEGLRGDPAFYSDVDLQEKRLLNVASITKETTGTTGVVSESPFDVSDPVAFESTLSVAGAASFASTSAHVGHATFTSAVFSGAVTFSGSYANFVYPIAIKTFSQDAIPTTSDMPVSGQVALWVDTSGGPDYYFVANISGTIYSVLLT